MMTALRALIRRDIKLFFKDKGLFFTSLITPLILLVLYSTFLGKVYRESFIASISGAQLPEALINGAVAGQLLSSLLAVCCITVAFCANMLMVQDKMNGARRDLTIAPVRSSQLALAYFAAGFAVTFLICIAALAAGLCYTAFCGWYLTLADVVTLIGDVFLLTLMGAALSSIVNSFLSTQGQSSAVGTIVSSGYGFICGAYMPVSQFGKGLRAVISLLPGTYGTGLMRNHAMGSALDKFAEYGVSGGAMTALRDALDLNLYFFGKSVSIGAMYAVLIITIAVLISVYVLICRLRRD